MYDEFERAMTGRTPKRGMGPLGWTLTTVGLLFVVGVAGVGFALNRATHAMGDFARDFDVSGGLAGLAALADVDAQTRLLSMDPEEGLDFLDRLATGDPADAFTKEMVQGTFDLAQVERRVRRGVRVSQARDARADRGGDDVQVDLDRRDGGGSLVINAGGEELRFDLVRTGSGGFLTVGSKDGQTRIDLHGTGEGGYLSIDSDEGNVRFDLKKHGDGGQLVIRTDDESVRLGVGDGADGMPVWVPAFGMPERPRPVYSLDAREGLLGAATWSADAAPSEILGYYRQELEAQGYEIRDRYRRTAADEDEGSFWARNEADGRMVFVVAHQKEAETRLLVGYGEER